MMCYGGENMKAEEEYILTKGEDKYAVPGNGVHLFWTFLRSPAYVWGRLCLIFNNIVLWIEERPRQ